MALTLLQGLVTVFCLEVMRLRGVIDYDPWKWDLVKKVRLPSLSSPSFRVVALRTQPPLTPLQVAPLSFVFIGYVVVSLISLGRVNVPMFTALRRLTILFVMIEEYFLLRIKPSVRIVATVGVMFLGAAIAAWKDLSYDAVSYFYLFLTNLFTSLYTVRSLRTAPSRVCRFYFHPPSPFMETRVGLH